MVGNYAGFWLRFVAAFIDGIILVIPMMIIIFGLGMMMGGIEKAASGGLGNLVGIVLPWLYYAYMESSEGQATIGKKVMSIRVTDVDGNRISFLRATARFFLKYVSSAILLIGYIMAAFTERKQALHDMIAGTLVVRG